MSISNKFTNFYLPLNGEDFLFVEGFTEVSNHDEVECVDEQDNSNFNLAYPLYDLNIMSEA